MTDIIVKIAAASSTNAARIAALSMFSNILGAASVGLAAWSAYEAWSTRHPIEVKLWTMHNQLKADRKKLEELIGFLNAIRNDRGECQDARKIK